MIDEDKSKRIKQESIRLFLTPEEKEILIKSMKRHKETLEGLK